MQKSHIDGINSEPSEKRKNLSLFLNVDGTIIVKRNGKEIFNPYLFDFLNQILPLFEQAELHIVTFKRPPEEFLSQLCLKVKIILDHTNALKEEKNCKENIEIKRQQLASKLEALLNNIKTSMANHPIIKSSEKMEKDDKEEESIVELDEKCEKLIKFSPLYQAKATAIQERLTKLTARLSSFSNELDHLLKITEGEFSKEKIIAQLFKELKLETKSTFTYLGSREKTPHKINHILDTLQADDANLTKIIYYIDNNAGEIYEVAKHRIPNDPTESHKTRDKHEKKGYNLQAAYVYSQNEPKTPVPGLAKSP